MPITTESALIGIACLIAQAAGPGEKAAMLAKLEPTERFVVEKMLEEEACLPANFERLLEKTRRDVAEGKDMELRMLVSERCRGSTVGGRGD